MSIELEEEVTASGLELLAKLDADVKKAATQLGQRSVRSLVDLYYQIQRFRIRAAGQVRSSDAGDPNLVVQWSFENMRRLEGNLRVLLGVFAKEYRVGQWLQSICGIGPVISAGLLAHLDVRGCKNAGHFWSFAGLDPTKKMEKGKKRPWNGELKTLVVFKAGECFVKVQNNTNDFYGQLYATQKRKLIERNEAMEFADAAKLVLEEKSYRKDTVAKTCYEAGQLPPAHIHARARRWMAKLFLSHVHHVMFEDFYGERPMQPYSFEHCPGDHRHFIDPPNWPHEGGKKLAELYRIDPPMEKKAKRKE